MVFLKTARAFSQLMKYDPNFVISKYANQNIKVNKQKILIRL